MSAFNTPDKIYYETPPMTIGKHEWKILVVDFYLGGRCTKFQFRKKSSQNSQPWFDDKLWNSYDINDTYNGLPKNLSKFYYSHEEDIKEHLDDSYLRKQLELF